MNSRTVPQCPPMEDLSAFMDGELAAAQAEAVKGHAFACPMCRPLLDSFSATRVDLAALRAVRCQTDLAAIVLPQLPRRAPRRMRARPSRARWWQFAPGAAAGAAALGMGAYLGLTLMAGGGAVLRPAAMSVFDGERAGTYCAGLPSCSAPRR